MKYFNKLLEKSRKLVSIRINPEQRSAGWVAEPIEAKRIAYEK